MPGSDDSANERFLQPADSMSDLDKQIIVNLRDGAASANSRDIAASFDKEHRDVLRAIDNLLLQEPGLGPRNFAQGYYTLAATGEQRHRCFYMDRDGFTLLAMGFTGPRALKWKLAYIGAFNRMEAELRAALPTFQIPSSLPEALRLAADNAERADVAEAKIAIDAPKVAFADQVIAAPDAISLSEAAKISGTGRNRLSSLLKREGWLTRYGEPYQAKVDSGDLDVKISRWEHPKDGLKKRTTPLVTGKGLSKIVALVRREGLAA